MSLLFLVVCVMATAFGTWHKFTLIGRKEALLEKVRSGQETADANEALTGELILEYEQLRPVLAQQQNTADTLRTLSLLEQAQSNRVFWYVLVADQQSYFSYVPLPPATNNSPTNPPPPIWPGFRPASVDRRGDLPLTANTNYAIAKPGLIAELSMAEDAVASRNTLSQLVNKVKEQKLFAKVDLLSEDLRRNLALPSVVVPDRHYALALDFGVAEFQQPVPPRKAVVPPLDRGPRRPSRPAAAGNGPAEKKSPSPK